MKAQGSKANNGITLPPDRRLLSDLCAPKWEVRGSVVKVESREEIYSRIKRSPDFASALCLALIDTPRRPDAQQSRQSSAERHQGHDPFACLVSDYRLGYDPYGANFQ